MRAFKCISLFAGLAVVLTLLFVIGCSNNSPVRPDIPDPTESGLSSLSLGGVLTLNSFEEFDSALVSKTTGGTIDIDRDIYHHEFFVDSNAIDETTLITVRSVNEMILGKEMILFEFGPDGLEFRKSAILSFDMTELSEEAAVAKLYYYDPIKKKWAYQTSVNVVNDIANFNIDHFSKYAISD